MKKIILASILAVSLPITVMAQESAQEKLSETEQLKIQVLNLQFALRAEQEKTAQLTTVYGQCMAKSFEKGGQADSLLSSEIQKLKDDIEKNHDGFSFDLSTGQFTKKPVEQKK